MWGVPAKQLSCPLDGIVYRLTGAMIANTQLKVADVIVLRVAVPVVNCFTWKNKALEMMRHGCDVLHHTPFVPFVVHDGIRILLSNKTSCHKDIALSSRGAPALPVGVFRSNVTLAECPSIDPINAATTSGVATSKVCSCDDPSCAAVAYAVPEGWMTLCMKSGSCW